MEKYLHNTDIHDPNVWKKKDVKVPSEQRIVMFIRATLSVDLFAMSEEWSAYHRAYANNAFDSVQKILTIFCGMYIKAVVLDEWYDVRRKMLFAMSEEWSAYHRAYANNAFDSVQKILTIFCGMYIKAVVLDEWYDVRRKMSCKGLTDDKWVLRVLVEEPTLKIYLSLTLTFWHDVLFRSVYGRNMEDFWSAVHEWIVIRLRNDIAENDIELFQCITLGIPNVEIIVQMQVFLNWSKDDNDQTHLRENILGRILSGSILKDIELWSFVNLERCSDNAKNGTLSIWILGLMWIRKRTLSGV